MGQTIGDWLAVLAVVAIVYVLVRPQSKAAELVEGFGGMVVVMVQRATGLAETHSGSIPRPGKEAS